MKRWVKIAVDILMFVLYLYLMGYRPGRSGLYEHGVLGMTLLGLFFLHHILNIEWYKSLRKGRYPLLRKLLIAVDFSLLAMMILMALSSMMIAWMIFPVSVYFPSQVWRTTHVASTAWGFTLMSIHVGLHTHGLFNRLERKAGSWYYVVYAVLLCIGVFALSDSGLWGKMILEIQWQNVEDPVLFYVEYLTIVISLCLLTHLVIKAQSRLAARRRPPADDR